MNQYCAYSINYPGIFSLKPNTWFKFSNNIGKFAFLIESVQKGLVINDQNNSIICEKNGLKLENSIDHLNKEYYTLKPVDIDENDGFLSIIESDFEKGRSFYEKGFTRFFLLLERSNEDDISKIIKECLRYIFVVYNSNVIESPILPLNSEFLNESIIIYESKLESKKDFDELVESNEIFRFSFGVKEIRFAQSKFGVLPIKEPKITSSDQVNQISDDYFDIFELYSLGLMQMNYYRNYKLALLECFVAVEMLVTRITESEKRKRGVAEKKIKRYATSVDLSYKMDVELKLFYQFDEKEISLLGQMVRARSLRNKIMHENVEVPEKEVGKLIADINKFIFMLVEKGT